MKTDPRGSEKAYMWPYVYTSLPECACVCLYVSVHVVCVCVSSPQFALSLAELIPFRPFIYGCNLCCLWDLSISLLSKFLRCRINETYTDIHIHNPNSLTRNSPGLFTNNNKNNYINGERVIKKKHQRHK